MNRIEQFPEFYRAELLSHLQPLEEKRREIVKQVKRVGLVLALLTFALIGAGRYVHAYLGGSAVGVGLMLCFGGGIALAVTYSQKAEGFAGEFKDTVIDKIVRFVDPGLSYHKQDYIREPVYMASRIFLTSPDRYHGEDLVQGTIGKTDIRFSEVHSEYKTERTDKDGKREDVWHTIFKGIFFIADFNKDFHGETVVLPDVAEKLFGRFGQMLQSWNLSRSGELVQLEDAEFEQRFVVYSDDQVEARYLLSTSLMARILDFVRRTGKAVHLSFVASKLHVAISYSKNLFEPRLFSSLLDIKLAQEYLEDLLLAVSIVEDLNLNTRIWTKQ